MKNKKAPEIDINDEGVGLGVSKRNGISQSTDFEDIEIFSTHDLRQFQVQNFIQKEYIYKACMNRRRKETVRKNIEGGYGKKREFFVSGLGLKILFIFKRPYIILIIKTSLFQVLNSTHISWATIRKLIKTLPSLEELHLCFNEYHGVGLCENCEIEREAHEKKLVRHEGVKRVHFTGWF